VGGSMVLKLILHGLFDDSAELEEIDLENMMIANILYMFMMGPVCILAASVIWLLIYYRHFASLALWFSGLYIELDCVE
jgi:hypothetical protein